MNNDLHPGVISIEDALESSIDFLWAVHSLVKTLLEGIVGESTSLSVTHESHFFFKQGHQP